MSLSSPQITTIDFLIMLVYILITLAIILILRLKDGEGENQFFLGNRNLPGWLNGISYAAAFVNLDRVVMYSGLAVITGLYVCWWYLARYTAGWMIAAFLFASFWHKTNLATPADFYRIRFSGSGAVFMRGWVAFRSAFISAAAWGGAGLLAFTKIAGPIFGFTKLQALLIIVPVTLLLIIVSGYRGIVVTSAFHSVIIIAGLLVLAVAVLWDFNGPLGLQEALIDSWGKGVLRSLPPGKDELLSVYLVVIWFFSGFLGYGGDAAPLESPYEGQRILSSKSPKEASKIFFWSTLVSFGVILLVTLPSLGAMALWPDLRTPLMDHELAFGLMIKRYFPPGVLGLFVISLMSISISSMAGHLNAGAQMAVFDLYRPHIKPEASEEHYLSMGRILGVVILLLAIPIAMGTNYLVDIVAFLIGINLVSKPADWAQWWWWRFNIYARLVASVGGPFIYLAARYLIIPAEPYWEQLLVSTLVCSSGWVTIAFFTRPPEREKLTKFYKTVSPPGLWGPIRNMIAHQGKG
ncbi:MAG: hypothetical protein ACE5GM_06130 [bacterium]